MLRLPDREAEAIGRLANKAWRLFLPLRPAIGALLTGAE